MKGHRAVHGKRARWRTVLLAIAGWAVSAGLRLCALGIAVFVVAPMSVRRRLSGPRPAHAGPRR